MANQFLRPAANAVSILLRLAPNDQGLSASCFLLEVLPIHFHIPRVFLYPPRTGEGLNIPVK